MKIAIIGGGAAGFFAALAAKECNPEAEVSILERSAKLLSKVRISGGGRCNVTHACFDPRQLVQNYPRGNKELLGPFHRFQPRDMIAWFEARGITLKEESDGRMFPITDSSQTIIDCFLEEAQKLGATISTESKLKSIEKGDHGFILNGRVFVDRVIMATGSAPAGWEMAKSLGHTIQKPVPSLFTFNIPDFPLKELSGISVEKAKLHLKGSRIEQTGPLLITHWGFSGPAALKLSAWGARYLAEEDYTVSVSVDWLPECDLRAILGKERGANPAKQLGSVRIPNLPKNLWKALCERSQISSQLPLSGLSKAALSELSEVLHNDCYQVRGKTTNKEEFVTCGGVTLSEVNFKTMESKCCPGLYFCGEILDVDGVTGGFNFQNAWTTGYIAGEAAAMP